MSCKVLRGRECGTEGRDAAPYSEAVNGLSGTIWHLTLFQRQGEAPDGVDIGHFYFVPSHQHPELPFGETPLVVLVGGKASCQQVIDTCSHQEHPSFGSDPGKQGCGRNHSGGGVLTQVPWGYPQLQSLPWFPLFSKFSSPAFLFSPCTILPINQRFPTFFMSWHT